MTESHTTEYEAVRYSGNLTGEDGCQEGKLLGFNELGMPWEVLDAEYDAAADQTTVHLRTASPEAITAAVAHLQGGQ